MTEKWMPTNEEREIMENVWMQVKGACEKPKEETNPAEVHVARMLKEWQITIPQNND